MRDIKFEYGFESVNGIVKKSYNLHEIPNIKNICDVWNILPIKYVRQYTGLKDKNGTEIYEGDIVKVGMYLMKDHPDYNAIRTVIWGGEINGSEFTHDVIGFALYPCENLSIPNLDYNDDDLNIEVIGNIYENQELLK